MALFYLHISYVISFGHLAGQHLTGQLAITFAGHLAWYAKDTRDE